MAWEGEPFAMGSIRPMLAANSQERALAARREAIQGWLRLMRPEDRSAEYVREVTNSLGESKDFAIFV
jgi:hypothetical protein